ncbi:V-type ATP synthase subunit A [Candidatus Aerophobetes bacterium]|uniref:V-type ATP synthase alpha chain n=1 Tax=Aerophobetes bacterium TaxID=2030807 RepID=A0A2A4X875_UNCAE|nr:MAG: V-type ATP synthase subunit A [Candidatus Aerophobetes bacterium]
MSKEKQQATQGEVIKAFGNLLHVRFFGNIRQGEIGTVHIGDVGLKAEVIEIESDMAKLQVFEDIRDVKYKSLVTFSGHLLEAELGPGLLSSVIDGLQNPLEKIAEVSGFFLERGVYIPPIDREKKWDFTPKATVAESVKRGDCLGTTREGRFTHKIMVPFSFRGSYEIKWVSPAGSFTVETVIAKLENSRGETLEVTMLQKWPIKTPLIEGRKISVSEMMETGCRVIDTQFPLMKGGTFCSPGPFGAGKTVLQHHLSKYSTVDIVIITACGERAGEVVEVLKTFPTLQDPHTKEPLMNRTIIVCNTSSMPVAAREASVYMGVTIAEYYRQMGLNVLLLADSTSRWAQAMREMSGRLEEIPGEEAFPAYLGSRIAAFYERAGVLLIDEKEQGSLTIGGTVSPAGGNFEEPVTQATLSVVGAFLGLSRARSDARRYPAIDPLISWSKYVGAASRSIDQRVEGWDEKNKRSQQVLREGDEIGKRMEVVGEEGVSIDHLVAYLKAELYDFAYLQQNAFDPEDAYCSLERQIELFSLIDLIFQNDFVFDSHDTARSFFLQLQGAIKNMNFISFNTEKYEKKYHDIKQKIESSISHHIQDRA